MGIVLFGILENWGAVTMAMPYTIYLLGSKFLSFALVGWLSCCALLLGLAFGLLLKRIFMASVLFVWSSNFACEMALLYWVAQLLYRGALWGLDYIVKLYRETTFQEQRRLGRKIALSLHVSSSTWLERRASTSLAQQKCECINFF